MDSLNKSIPSIRFKEYEKDWEFKKLSEVNTFFSDGNYGNNYPRTSDLTDKLKGVPFLRGSNIVNGKLTEINANYITKEKHIQLVSGHLYYDDIVIAVRGSLGVLGYVDYQNVGWNINSQLAIIRTDKKQLSGSYLLQFLLSPKGQFSIISKISGSALKQLPIGQVKELSIPITVPKEQTQIGNFFKTLDEQINLQEQKHQKLVNLKKAMLEKMFPKEGADTPEIRFKGFTEKWNFVELGDVLKERKIIQKISKDAPILAFAAGQGVIDRSQRKSNNRDHLTKDASNKKYLLTEFNDIVYNPSNLKYGAIDRNKYGRGVISPIYVTFITEQIPSFIELIVKGENFKIKALQYEEGTVVKRQSVKPENLLSLKVFISQSLEEQQKIGDYFENLDNLIQQAQLQLEKHKNIKQALLQKMFV